MVDPRLRSQPESEPWIFDTGPLSHFAKAGWLGLVKLMSGTHPVIIPDAVHAELQNGVRRYPYLDLVLDATSSWITVREIVDTDGIAAFGRFSTLLVGEDGMSNVGECGVLALAQTLPGIAFLDDRVARNIASSHHVEHHGSLTLLLDAVRHHGLPRAIAGSVADDILASDYRYPFRPGKFITWAVEHGHLEPEN